MKTQNPEIDLEKLNFRKSRDPCAEDKNVQKMLRILLMIDSDGNGVENNVEC